MRRPLLSRGDRLLSRRPPLLRVVALLLVCLLEEMARLACPLEAYCGRLRRFSGLVIDSLRLGIRSIPWAATLLRVKGLLLNEPDDDDGKERQQSSPLVGEAGLRMGISGEEEVGGEGAASPMSLSARRGGIRNRCSFDFKEGLLGRTSLSHRLLPLLEPLMLESMVLEVALLWRV